MDGNRTGAMAGSRPRKLRVSDALLWISPARWPKYLLTAAGTVFTFEATLILFLFAGVYKADPRFAWLPVDITALFFLASVLAGAYIVWAKGVRVRGPAAVMVWLYAALLAYALLSMLWSPSVFYAHSKTLYLATLVFWPLAGGALIIAPDPVRYRRFFLLLLLFSGWVALESGLAFWLGTTSGALGAFVEALSGTYLSLGRVIGPGFLVLVAYTLFLARTAWLRIALGLVSVLMLGLLLVIGGRMPLIAAGLGCLVLLAALRPRLGRTPQRLLLQLGIAAAIAAILLAGWQFAPRSIREAPATIRRIGLLFIEGVEENRRIEHYKQTLLYLDNDPFFGQGIGSWPVVTGYGDARAYPHNVFLELLFELGLIGLGLFLAMVFTGLLALPPWRKLRQSPYALLALAMFLSALINASVSGDLNDNRLLFATLGLLLLGRARQPQPEVNSVERPGPVSGQTQRSLTQMAE
jgi:O-antigen ligase